MKKTRILDSLRTHGWSISPDEQDAHELLHVLTETLEDEVSKTPATMSLFDAAKLEVGTIKCQHKLIL